MRREQFRGVVWPRQGPGHPPISGPEGPIYRYAVVGMIATDRPLEPFSSAGTHWLCGGCCGLSAALARVPEGEHKWQAPGAEAGNILVSLGDIQPKRPKDSHWEEEL